MSLRFRRSFAWCLILVLSLMVLKNFVLEDHPQHGSCDEFGHIHWSFDHAQDPEKGHEPGDNHRAQTECRAGQSIFAYAVVLPVPMLAPPVFESEESWISRPVRINEDPVLEPRRRPPRFA